MSRYARIYGGMAAAIFACLLLAAGAAGPAAAAPPATDLDVFVHRGTVRAGVTAPVLARLFGAGGEPLAGEPVTLYERPEGAADYVAVAGAVTDAYGGAAFQVRPEVRTSYLVRHPETAAGAASADSASYAVVASPRAPTEPEHVVVYSGDGAIPTRWLPPEDAGGDPVTSYALVARRVSDGATFTHTVGGDARSAAVPVPNGFEYYVTVTAHTASGSASAVSTAAVARAGAPAPPTVTGTPLCGRLPFGVTRLTAAGSPYAVCPSGLVVPTGATLEADGATVLFTPPGGVDYDNRRVSYTLPYGIDVAGGTVRLTGSTLRGATGRPGEWSGVELDFPTEDLGGDDRSGSVLAVSGSTLRYAATGVHSPGRASWLSLADTVVAETSGDGVRTRTPVRLTRVTVRDARGNGVDATCLRSFWYAYADCPLTLHGVTVERAAGRGLTVETTKGPVSVRDAVVTGSGTAAPVSEAARFTGMTASLGAGGAIEDVRGGGNGIDAVVLDLTATNDLVWRSPAAGSAAAPTALGYVVRSLRMAPGRSVTFPAGSVVKGVPAPAGCETRTGGCPPGISVDGATLDASAPGSVFTGVADETAGVVTCPSALAPSCGVTHRSWPGLSVGGLGARALLTGATVRGAAVGLDLDGSAGNTGDPVTSAALVATTFDRNAHAVRAAEPSDPRGSLTLTDVTVTDSGKSVDVVGFATVEATRTTVRRSAGVSLGGGWGSAGCGTAVSVTGLLVEEAPGTGLDLTDLCRPKVRDVTVRRSGLPGPDDSVGRPAVEVRGVTMTVGPGGDLDGFAGGGNGIDGIALGGDVVGDLAWVSPYNSPVDHPLGYLLGGTGYVGFNGALRVVGDHRVTVPPGALVASLRGRGLFLAGPDLGVSAGARFVDVHDPLAADLGCRRDCATRSWEGVVTGADHGPGDVRVVGATVRGAPFRIAGGGTAAVTVADTSSDGAFTISEPASVAVTGSTLAHLYVTGARAATVSGNTVPAPDGAIRVGGIGGTTPFVLRDNVVAAGTAGPAYVLAAAHATFGSGGTVSGNTGSGVNAVLALADVSTAADLTWVTPTEDPEPHPVGYVVTRVGDYLTQGALTVHGPATLRLPAGAVVKADVIRLRGATLDATAGGATVTSPSDGVAGTPLCSWAPDCDDPDTEPTYGLPAIDVGPAETGDRKAGGVAINAARLYASLTVNGFGSADAPGAPGYGVAIASSYARGPVSVVGTAASLTATRFAGGVRLGDSRGNVVRDVTVADSPRRGIRLDSAQAEIVRTVVTRSATAPEYQDLGALQLLGTSGGTFGCLDLRDNGAGLVAHTGTTVAVADSTLAGNAAPAATGVPAAYDLDNTTQVNTVGVWWGQPGGPVPGQVRDPAKHMDLAPRSAPPACATAATAAPPSAPRDVAATAGADDVTATWDAPATDGGSPVTGYRATLLPGGTTRTVAAGARSVTFPGLRAGRAYVVTVTALNAAGSGPASRASNAVRPGVAESPAPTGSADPSATPTPTLTGSPTPTTPAPTTPAPTTPAPTTPAPTTPAPTTPPPTETPGPTAPARAATTLSVSAPRVVTYGTAARVTGRLTTASGAVPSRRVDLYVRRTGAARWNAPIALTTDASGYVAYTLRPAANTDVQLRYAGDATTQAAASAVRTVQVRPVITASLSRTSAPLGSAVTLSGRLSPALPGRTVRLERYTRSGWQRVTETSLTRTSAYFFSLRPGRRGTYYYRVVYDATATHARAVSPTRSLRVT